MQYKSTRGTGETVSPSYAILHGIAEDGGLFVPEEIPRLAKPLEELSALSYQQLAVEIMGEFLTDFTREELEACAKAAYDSKFDTPQIAPLAKRGDHYFLELFHGATLAFKDMALSILPHLLKCSAQKQKLDKKIVILTATSGDTGKAALEGFANVEGVEIIVFYPKDGVSPIQKRQMVTQKGDNTHVVAIEGNFDDAQRSVKEIFTDPAVAARMRDAGYMFSSANSINIGRLVPQVVYYFAAYFAMVEQKAVPMGAPIDFCVPTGNFGNILAAYYAKGMGLPVGKLLCASNSNNVLTDFFQTGEYNANREFYLTMSPSMDILVSSNLERLIYEICGRDGGAVADLMGQLSQQGQYKVNAPELPQIFYGGYASEEETAAAIREVYAQAGYVMDPHTAVAWCVKEKYLAASSSAAPAVVISTASPYKFPQSILSALGEPAMGESEQTMVDRISALSHTPVPASVKEVLSAPVRHRLECGRDGALQAVESILGL